MTIERQNHADAGILGDVVDAVLGEAAVERHVGGVDLLHREQGHVAFDRAIEQKTDDIAGAEVLRDHVAGETVGGAIELAVSHRTLLAVDREMGAVAGALELVAALLEQVMQALAGSPADTVVAGREQDDVVEGALGFGKGSLKGLGRDVARNLVCGPQVQIIHRLAPCREMSGWVKIRWYPRHSG